MSTPYAVSSDLVSAYPAKSLAVAQFIDGYKTSLAMVQNTQTGTSYTFALADFTKLVTLNNAAAVAVTLPLEATVAWETGTQLRLVNLGAGTVTVAGAVGVTINGTPLTLAQYKGANLIKTGTNTWVFVPFASSIGAAVYSDANTGTYTGFAYKTFSASGTLTVTQAGFADLFLVAGGAAGGYNVGGGGGGGGVVAITNAYLPVGTLTCTIAAGGSASSNTPQGGLPTRLGDYFSPGGGPGGGTGAINGDNGKNGASGGGGQKTSGTGGTGDGTIGNNGGNGSASTAGGGGGGGSAVGAVGSGTSGGAGGGGTGTTIAGTTPTGAYVAGTFTAGGGGGGGGSGAAGAGGTGGGGNGATAGAGTAGTANTGGGGGGTAAAASFGGNGGSGLLIVRVAV